mmetsp:Transcript_12159/g.42146  ORF Transcript_12159/g.42146 Transcript_12159/m.42146 type:complete len:205 (+) Transcript_12159:3899-4513(+)
MMFILGKSLLRDCSTLLRMVTGMCVAVDLNSRTSVGSTRCRCSSTAVPKASRACSTLSSPGKRLARSVSDSAHTSLGSSSGRCLRNSSPSALESSSSRFSAGMSSVACDQYSCTTPSSSSRYLRMCAFMMDTSRVSWSKRYSRRPSSQVRTTWKSAGITLGRYGTHERPMDLNMNMRLETTILWCEDRVWSWRTRMSALMATVG